MVAHAFNNVVAAVSVPLLASVGELDPVNEIAFGLAVAIAGIVWLRTSLGRPEAPLAAPA